MRLGSTALVEKPKFGDVMTPEGRLRFTLSNAFVMFANTFRLVRVPPPYPLAQRKTPLKCPVRRREHGCSSTPGIAACWPFPSLYLW